MEYNVVVHTVVEMPQYLKASKSIFTESERADIVAMVATDPECGDVMEGFARCAWVVALLGNVEGRA